MKVEVRGFEGPICTLDLIMPSTLAEVKLLIAEKTGISRELQNLIVGTVILNTEALWNEAVAAAAGNAMSMTLVRVIPPPEVCDEEEMWDGYSDYFERHSLWLQEMHIDFAELQHEEVDRQFFKRVDEEKYWRDQQKAEAAKKAREGRRADASTKDRSIVGQVASRDARKSDAAKSRRSQLYPSVDLRRLEDLGEA